MTNREEFFYAGDCTKNRADRRHVGSVHHGAVFTGQADGQQAGFSDNHVRLYHWHYHRLRGGGAGDGAGGTGKTPYRADYLRTHGLRNFIAYQQVHSRAGRRHGKTAGAAGRRRSLPGQSKKGTS
ncbi:hypothetical protein SDC9_175230 [bioreactor metagenome]|uniref:Uncharacterized protein n=1 Tax=bioreactor metagenome TaxID=1076179 RepID=A0A645GNP5_9ZZZZ